MWQIKAFFGIKATTYVVSYNNKEDKFTFAFCFSLVSFDMDFIIRKKIEIFKDL